MPDDQDKRMNPGGEPNSDFLEQLLVMAAEKEAQKAAEDALRKGFVTREQINAALTTFGAQLTEQIQQKIVESVTSAIMPQVEEVVKKAAGTRKSTVTPEEDFETDPVAFILKKGHESGPESYTDVEKRVIWEVTHKALIQGMEFDNREEM